MKILAVRGENLASLALPFELSFEEGPLAAAGLFVITGPTGAGKSTILDAICLALYGEFPRSETGATSVRLKDVGGGDLSSQDTRNVLRRNAPHGYAEVDFLGVNGAAYRARWTVRRAKKQSTGRLQQIEQTVTLLRDSGPAQGERTTSLAPNAVAEAGPDGSTPTAVKEFIRQKVGLTYTEFCRSVLLAQGAFDTFLRADGNSRAAILERLAGSHVFRSISMEVFLRSARSQKELELLEGRRGELSGLSTEERVMLASEQEIVIAKAHEAGDRVAKLDAQLAEWERERALSNRLEESTQSVIRAKQSFDAAAEERAELVEILALRELSPAFLATAAAHQQALSASDLEAAALLAQTAATSALAEVESAQKRAEEDLVLVTKRYDEDLPKLLAAEQRALRLPGLRSERERLNRELAPLAKALSQATEAAEAAEKAGRAHEQATRALEEKLLATARFAPLVASAEAITAEIHALYKFRAESTAKERQLKESKAALEGVAEELRVHDEKLALATTALEAATATLGAQPTGAERAELAAEELALALCEKSLTEWQVAASAVEFHTLQVEKLRATAALAEREENAARHHVGERQAALSEARIRASEVSRFVALLDRSVADTAAYERHLADLRSQLSPGVPCPVCFHDDHDPARFSALEEAFRGERERARALVEAREAAEKAEVIAQADLAAAMRALEAARAGHEEGRVALESASAEAARLGDVLLAAWMAVPDAGEEAPGFAFVREQIPLRRARVREERAAQRAAQTAYAIAEREREACRMHVDGLRHVRAPLAEKAASLTAVISGLHADCISCAQQLQEERARLEGRLRSFEDPTVELAGNTASTLAATLARLASERRRDEASRALLTTEAAELVARRARTEADAQTARAAVISAEALRDAAARAFAEEESQVATLLRSCAGRGGEGDFKSGAGDNAETLLEGLRRALEETKGASMAAVEGARTRREEARLLDAKRRDECLRAREFAGRAALEATDRQRDLAHALSSLRARLPVRSAEVSIDEALALEDSQVRERAERVREMEVAITRGEEASVRAAEELALHRKGRKEDPGDEAALREERNNEDSLRIQFLQRQGAIAEQLSADDRVAQAVRGLDEEIRCARARAKSWADLNSVVGSADGDKFAKLAQSHTLELVLAQANLSLETLRPRYQLARVPDRELDILVIDREFAGEARSIVTLSGGERFLVSLALALGLAELGSERSAVETLFLDEGFGTLDPESLDLAIAALEALQARGRTIGIVSHVPGLADRIGAQVRVRRLATGSSVVEIVGKPSKIDPALSY